jgi:hypothetical protein
VGQQQILDFLLDQRGRFAAPDDSHGYRPHVADPLGSAH